MADPADIAAASRSVVRVVLISSSGGKVSLVGHGSGFAVGPDLIVTNAHVVAPLAQDQTLKVGIVPPQGQTGWFAKVAAFSPRNDLALLRLSETGKLTPATLFSGAVTDGEDVYAVGYPGNVDLAQGLNPADLMSPTEPVKTRGSVSSGRSSRDFDTILHTAPIGAGNSGGPLLDACGRVVGANSFGTEASSQADSEFYFAISIREISRFLIGAGVTPLTTGEPCRSFSDLDRAEAARVAGSQAQAQEQAAASAAKQAQRLQQAERQAELEVFAARENRMGIAGILLLLALGAGGYGAWAGMKGDATRRKLGLAGAMLLCAIAVATWFTRPSLSAIDSRAHELVTPEETASASATTAAAAPGSMVCTLNRARSRVTVSDTADVPLDWRDDGCVNGRIQYAPGGGGWSKIQIPDDDDTAAIASYDPTTHTWRADRYMLDHDTMEQLRKERAKSQAPACGAGPDAAQRLSEAQGVLLSLLPSQPNERLVYDCHPQQ